MKKNCFYLLTALLVAMVGLGLSACSDNDSEGESGSSYQSMLIGTWKYNYDGDTNNYQTVTFRSNGTGVFNRPSWNQTFPFTYEVVSYDSDSHSGTMKYAEEGRAFIKPFSFIGTSTLIYEGFAWSKIK